MVRSRLIPVGASIHGHELAGFASRVMKLAHHQRDILPLTYKLQPFFRITALSASLSRLRSATMCLSRRFSSSTSLSRRAPLTSLSPYLLFQGLVVAHLTPHSRPTSFAVSPAYTCFS